MINLRFFKINKINISLVEGINVSHITPRHFHNTYNIGIIFNGSRKLTHKNNCYLIPSNSIITINPGEIHSLENLNNTSHCYKIISFNLDYIKNNCKDKLLLDNKIPEFKNIFFTDKIYFNQINQLFELLKNSNSILEKESIFFDFIINFFVKYSDFINPEFETIINHPCVKIIKEFIDENYSKNFSIEELSEIGCMSPYHLNRIFKKEIGLPPHRYQNYIRIKRSEDFLNSGNDIADVAYKIGFFDQSHFTKIFKKYIGLSPLDYQNKSIIFS